MKRFWLAMCAYSADMLLSSISKAEGVRFRAWEYVYSQERACFQKKSEREINVVIGGLTAVGNTLVSLTGKIKTSKTDHDAEVLPEGSWVSMLCDLAPGGSSTFGMLGVLTSVVSEGGGELVDLTSLAGVKEGDYPRALLMSDYLVGALSV